MLLQQTAKTWGRSQDKNEKRMKRVSGESGESFSYATLLAHWERKPFFILLHPHPLLIEIAQSGS